MAKKTKKRRVKRLVLAASDQGCIGEAYALYLAPLLRYKPEEWLIKEWEEYLLDVDHRSITRFKVLKPFTMPGLFYVTPWTKVQGIGYRKVKAGSTLFVRIDSREKIVDIEWLGGQGSRDQVFCLTPMEWEWVAMHCRTPRKT